MSTVVHMKGIIVREQCPFAAYSTHLKTHSPCSTSCSCSYSMCTVLPIAGCYKGYSSIIP